MVIPSGRLRAFDIRFVLPALPGRVRALGLGGWPDGTAVAPGPPGGGTLVIVPRRDAPRPDASTSAVLYVGPPTRRLPPAGAGARHLHLLATPDLRTPTLVVCLEHPAAAAYALRVWSGGDRRIGRIRNVVAGHAARLPWALRPFASGVLVAAPGPPAVVAAAAAASAGEVDPLSGWFLTVPAGDDLARPVLHLVPPGAQVPSHAVKLTRVPGQHRPFEEDERALSLVARAGSVVAARVPRLVARIEYHGYAASVETSAPGAPLDRTLRRRGEDALPTVEAICTWILHLAETTARPGCTGPALATLADDVLAPRGLSAELLAPLAAVPGVLQHNDLGSWNIHVDRQGRFTVLDWESARDDGLPLWDLAYFLGDALPLLAGARSFEERADAAVQIFAGRHQLSPFAFEWVDRGARLLSIPHDAVGPAVLAGWLHHAGSHVARAVALGQAGAPAGALPPAERIADRWLADPALGAAWQAWRAWRQRR